MADVTVLPVSNRRDRREFVDLPWSLYRDDPHWIPPLLYNQSQLLGFRQHPFQENADIQCFVARRGDVVCGRVAAIDNHLHNSQYGEQIGFFGYFESVDDTEVSGALFDAVRDWFAARGIHQLRGPTQPSMNYECGLLIDGFDSPPTFMMTYNPPYYAKLIEDYGFRKSHDLLGYIGRIEQLPEIERKLAPMVEQIRERFEITVRGMDRSRFLEDVETFFNVYNEAMLTTWGFVPLPKSEMQHLGKSLKNLLIPELALVAEVDGKAVGAVLGLPDYNPRIKQINGRLLPFGFLKLVSNPKSIKRIRVLSINVLQEYQRWGVGIVLLSGLVPRIRAVGIEEAEFSWVSEANSLARQGLRKGGAEHNKTFRLYDFPANDSQTG